MINIFIKKEISFLFIIISCFANTMYGQAPYSKIKYKFSLDTAKNRILPFDIPFTVTIPNDKTNPYKYIYLFRVNGERKIIKDNQTSVQKSTLPLNSVYQNGDSLEIDIPPLKPDKQYVVIGVTEENKVAKLKELVIKFCKDQKDQIPEEDSVNLIPPAYFLTKDFDNHSLHFVETKEHILEIFKKSNEECKLCEKLALTQQAYTDPITSIPSAINTNPLINCDTCKTNFKNEIFFINGTVVVLGKWQTEVLTGVYPLDTSKGRGNIFVSGNIPAVKDEEKFQNIAKSLGILITIKQLVFYVSKNLSSANLSEYLSATNNYIDALKINLEILRTKLKEKNDFESCLKDMDLSIGQTNSVLSNTTSSYQFLTRNGYFIVPDFGLVYYSNKLFSNSSFAGVAPFIGFHINFRATNVNVPFWKIKSFWKFPVLQVGVPVFAQNLSADSSRKYLVGNKFSVFAGLGINLAHSARITFGAMFFQSLTAPSTYEIKAAPCISLGIDIRLKSYFRGLSDAIQGITDPF